jgi:hypothetical protein
MQDLPIQIRILTFPFHTNVKLNLTFFQKSSLPYTLQNLGQDPDPDMDRHQSGKLDPDPDQHQHDADPQH